MNTCLAVIHHDPEGRLYEQIDRLLPALSGIFSGIAVQASAASPQKSLDRWASAGALVRRAPEGHKIGWMRRGCIELALQSACPAILYCDSDRVLHWAERYPGELERVAVDIHGQDMVVLGRTRRAFLSHPRYQTETEAIINRVFESVSGRGWDVSAAARGLSRRAAEAVQACPDDEISTDVSWPLFLLRAGGFSFGYLETEGLEFETADRYPAEVAQAGGMEQWIASQDRDPRHWVHRLDLARTEIEAMLPYV